MGRRCSSRICLVWTRVLLRFIQFCSSLIAYVLLRTAGITHQSTAMGETVPVIIDSSALSFARIINFIAFIYALAFLIFIEWLRLCVHHSHYSERLLDFVILVCLTVATIVLLLSKVTRQCHGRFERFVNCGELYFALAMSFLSIFAFLGIVMFGKRKNTANNRVQQQSEGHPGHASVYQEETTPVATAV
ncbi:unnamed protein product [Peronospora destructor]|uniref:MARVEL domain-containing protein n=1 Tax=Peronospora destructor TaxID=86335 RepID=A0AAV0VC51_9STRA|nr:unnamed protein product [Peronospora destructor]